MDQFSAVVIIEAETIRDAMNKIPVEFDIQSMNVRPKPVQSGVTSRATGGQPSVQITPLPTTTEQKVVPSH